MNDRFRKLIEKSGWQYRDKEKDGSPANDFVKTYTIEYGDEVVLIPISMMLWKFDGNDYPRHAVFDFVLDTQITPNNANSSTILKGMSKVVTLFDVAGYMTAMKYLIFGHGIKHFDKKAKQLLANATVLPE